MARKPTVQPTLLAGCPCCFRPCGLQVEAHFARLIQRVMPKSYAQAVGEVRVTRTFLENFGGDQVGREAPAWGLGAQAGAKGHCKAAPGDQTSLSPGTRQAAPLVSHWSRVAQPYCHAPRRRAPAPLA